MIVLTFGCENSLNDINQIDDLSIPGWELDTIEFNYGWMSFNDVDFLSPDLGYMISTNGDFLKTINSAETWQRSDIEIDSGGVMTSTQSFISENIGYEYGHYSGLSGNRYGTLYKTKDGGDNWTKKFYEPEYKLYSMHFYNDSTGIALNSLQGEINVVTTYNSGDTWDTVNLDLSPTTYRLFFSGEICFVTGKNRKIIKSRDKGKTWITIDTPESSAEFIGGFYFYDEQLGFLNLGGKKYKTIDGGEKWDEVDIPFNFRTPYSPYEYFHFSDENNGIAIIDSTIIDSDSYSGRRFIGSIVYTTIDGGVNWQKSKLFKDFHFGCVVFATPDIGYCISEEYIYILLRE